MLKYVRIVITINYIVYWGPSNDVHVLSLLVSHLFFIYIFILASFFFIASAFSNWVFWISAILNVFCLHNYLNNNSVVSADTNSIPKNITSLSDYEKACKWKQATTYKLAFVIALRVLKLCLTSASRILALVVSLFLTNIYYIIFMDYIYRYSSNGRTIYFTVSELLNKTINCSK